MDRGPARRRAGRPVCRRCELRKLSAASFSISIGSCQEQARQEGGRLNGVFFIRFSKLRQRLFLLSARQPDVHRDENGKHNQCDERRPLDQKTQHDDNETSILRMAKISIGTAGSNLMGALGFVEHIPGGANQNEPACDKSITEPVQWVKMGVAFPPKERLQKMAAVM